MRIETGVAPIRYRATPIAERKIPPAPIFLHAVDGWRGIGSLGIVFGHLWLVTGLIRCGDLLSKPASTDGGSSIYAIWNNLFLVHTIGLNKSETWNSPSWSLSVEFGAYAVFAAFCPLCPVARRTASVAVVVGSLAILALVAPFHMRSMTLAMIVVLISLFLGRDEQRRLTIGAR